MVEEWEQPAVWETPQGTVRTPGSLGEGQRAQGVLVNTAASGRLVLDFVVLENPLDRSVQAAGPTYEVVSRVWMARDDATKLIGVLHDALQNPPGQVYVAL